MQESRILLHTSNYEGFGLVNLEALSAGAQVISFVRPMDQEIPRWHIVNNVDEMTAVAKQILSQPSDRKPVIPFKMEETVNKIMALYKLDHPDFLL
jgi:glycosyltransferase involved in cell wall biosynthesis